MNVFVGNCKIKGMKGGIMRLFLDSTQFTFTIIDQSYYGVL